MSTLFDGRGRATRKYMHICAILLMSLASGIAADKSGSGTNPLGTIALDDMFSLSFFTKDSNVLFWRLSWKPTDQSSSSVTSGSGVSPGAPFVYFWDDARETFWFATEKFLHKYDLSSAMTGSTMSRSVMIVDYKDEKDFPTQMAPMVESLLQKE